MGVSLENTLILNVWEVQAQLTTLQTQDRISLVNDSKYGTSSKSLGRPSRFPKSFSISGIQKCFTPKKTYLFLIMVTWNDESEVLVYKSLQFRALP
ncbi:Oidioi.mRNA.OKI2018_I69.XSR.g13847.t1.cds [Oikopleura dioica]|uniref:Oidioi.mRNA.OKI2018_I69.XSR.g13847.t1.cds n=1 Tax=Oikopleura dioica TaxID=34765 RepID=A0ABN7SCT6_OIKDI|nr:Oidioi.mRNA.OKI2018_I69.XSR.g13847.t1.cds [Oikopleura dioica]